MKAIETKIAEFATALESAQLASLVRGNVNCEANQRNCKVTTHEGKKYWRVDVGSSGKYMVDKTTEEILFIKGYGVPHKGHRFGTLDTIAEWDWSHYMARKIGVQSVADAHGRWKYAGMGAV